MDAAQLKLIDMAVGIIFIFLIVSIIITAVVEFIGSVLRLRSVNLTQGVITMLQDNLQDSKAANGPVRPGPSANWRSILARFIISHKGGSGVAPPPVVGAEAQAAPAGTLAADVLNHPLIANLAVGDRVPPRIESQLFTSALITVLNDEKHNTAPQASIDAAFTDVAALVGTMKNERVKSALAPMIAQAQAAADGAQEKAKAAIAAVEQWYDHSMTLASDWYKSRIQGVTLAVAAIVVIGGNVDIIRIAGALWTDDSLRQAYVAQATAAVESPDYLKSICPDLQGEKAAQCSIDTARNALSNLSGLPIGWRLKDYDAKSDASRGGKVGEVEHWAWKVAKHIPGWALTIFAASLGAPFWFGALQRVTPLRGGKSDPPAKTVNA